MPPLHKEPVCTTYVPYGSTAATLCQLAFLSIVFLLPILLLGVFGEVWPVEHLYTTVPRIRYSQNAFLRLDPAPKAGATQPSSPLLWSSLPQVRDRIHQDSNSLVFPQLKLRLEDEGNDADVYHISLQVSLPESIDYISTASLMLSFYVNLTHHADVDGEGVVWLQSGTSSTPGSAWRIYADLHLRQDGTLGHSDTYTIHPPHVPSTAASHLPGDMAAYVRQPVVLQAHPTYSHWLSGPAGDTFRMHAQLRIPASRILRERDIGPNLQFVWVQYTSLAVVFYLIGSSIVSFLFVQGIISSRRIPPNKKMF